MTNEERDLIKELFEESLFKSHGALAKTYSNQQGEVLSRLNSMDIRLTAIDTRLAAIDEKQRIANGRTTKNEDAILEGKKAITEIQLLHAEQAGEDKINTKTGGRFATFIISVGSSVVAVLFLYLFGMKK